MSRYQLVAMVAFRYHDGLDDFDGGEVKGYREFDVSVYVDRIPTRRQARRMLRTKVRDAARAKESDASQITIMGIGLFTLEQRSEMIRWWETPGKWHHARDYYN